MPVYTYKRVRKNKKDKSRKVQETWYYYEGQFTDPDTGKMSRYKKRGFSSLKEAEQAERIYLISLQKNGNKKITFYELSIVYLEYLENRRKYSTVDTTKTHLQLIYPFLGKKNIHDITSLDVISLQQKMLDNDYSISYINDVFGTIKKILNFGVKHHGLKNNVCTKVDKLISTVAANEENEMKCWTLDDFFKFIKFANDVQYKALYFLFYFTGLRRGEALALNWNDINFEKKTLKVTKTITNKLSKKDRKRGLKYKITTPKSKRSIRTISIPKILVDVLIQWKMKVMVVDGYSEESFIFGIERPLPYSTVDRKMKAWAKMAGIPILSPHGLRHSHISYLINKGVNILAVAQRAGDTVEMILKVYAHLFKQNELEIINIIDNDVKPRQNPANL